MTRALLALLLVAGAAAPGHGAPWSFELPEGYTEQPGAADAELTRLRDLPRTVSVDAQAYLSPDGNVRLTRMTWLSRFDVTPTRGGIESMDKGVASGGGKHGTIVSESRQLAGEQLVGEQVIDVGATRVRMRRLYAADTDRVVHMFTVVCAGPADALAECEAAQQTMQLVLPNQASLTAPDAEDRRERANTAYVIGTITGAAMLALLIWLWQRSGGHIVRRPKR